MEIHFTKHAKEKFRVLARHGVVITEKKVSQTVRLPERIDDSRNPLIIAQSKLNSDHVLRVVYKIEEGIIIIITFYPGRTSQYEPR